MARQTHLEVDEFAQHPRLDGLAKREERRAEAKLKVDGRGQLPLAANPKDALRLVEVAPHGLLHDEVYAARQCLDRLGHCGRGHGDVDDGVGHSHCVGE